MIFRGSRSILLETPIFLRFFKGGGSGPPVPPAPLWIRLFMPNFHLIVMYPWKDSVICKCCGVCCSSAAARGCTTFRLNPFSRKDPSPNTTIGLIKQSGVTFRRKKNKDFRRHVAPLLFFVFFFFFFFFFFLFSHLFPPIFRRSACCPPY